MPFEPMTPMEGDSKTPPSLSRSSSFKRKLSIPSVGYKRVLVLGSGSFGSCLADHLADVGHTVRIWARNKETVDSFNLHHKNPKYLTDHVFSKNLKAVGPEFPSFEDLQLYNVIVMAIPSQSMSSVLKQIVPLFELKKEKSPLMVFVNKGIEIGTCFLPIEIIEKECGKEIARVSTFLSGPSFAKEIVQRMPTQVTIASFSAQHAEQACEVFHQGHFLTFSSTDPIGVELSGSLKNVYAIASGVASGLGFQQNTRAGLVTRASAEMQKIGAAFNADPLTFMSLAGVGDLFLTCSSENSRNFTVGKRLGEGESLQHILDTLGSTAEGVQTASAMHDLLERLEMSAPIAEAVYDLLYKGATAADMADRLMGLPSMPELARPMVRRSSHSERFMQAVGVLSPYQSPSITPGGSPPQSPKPQSGKQLNAISDNEKK